MGRIHGHHAPPGASGAVGSVHHKRIEPKRKPPYKVVLEEIAGKKKLKTVLSLRERPPPGYTFIPAGDPQLTNRCKKLAKDAQLTVFIVSTSKHPHEQLSTEVHRVGYHFPSIIVDKSCTSLGVTLTQSGRVLQSKFAFIDDQGSSDQYQGRRPTKGKIKGKRRQASPKLDMSLSQAVIDTTAREAIKDLFPNIPSKDQKEIVGRAFQKGKGLVGTVSGLSLVRRAQLAVTAHIRHTYTNYDILLKSMRWGEARQAVQQACLDKLVQWRGDDDDDGEMADILQEVIVISDDEEGEDQHDINSLRDRDGRSSSSIEYLSAEHIKTQAVDYAAGRSGADQAGSLSPDSDNDDGVTYLGHVKLSRTPVIQHNQHRLHQMGAQRHRMWEEAVDRQRKNPGILYGTDSRPPLSAPGNLQPRYYQAQHETELQPHGSEPAVLRFDRRTPYIRVMPLPTLENPTRHSFDPCGRENRMLTGEVPQLSQKQSFALRSVEEPIRAFDAQESKPYNVERPSFRGQPYPVSIQQEDTRLVMSQELERDMTDKPHPYTFENSSRRRSELILPSIEDDLPCAEDQQAVSSQHRAMHEITQRHTGDRGMLRSRAFSMVRLDGEEPQTKRRRINDQQPLDDRHERTVLIPLQARGDDHQRMIAGPAEAVCYKGISAPTLDKRIVRLPPREQRRYEDSQKRVQIMDHDGHVENRPFCRMPTEEMQSHHVNFEALAQSHSPNRSVALQPLYDQQSPIFFNASAPPYREVLDQRLSSRHTFGVDERDAQVFSDPYRVSSRPQRIDEVASHMRADFRNMAIDPRRYRDYNINIDGDMAHSDFLDVSSQVPSTTKQRMSSPTDLMVPDREGHRQMPRHGNSLESRHIQRQHSTLDRATEPTQWPMPADIDGISRPLEKATTNPLPKYPSATVGKSAAMQWSRGGQSNAAASTMLADYWLPQTRANAGHVGNENVRPLVQPFEVAPHKRGRAPGKVVVLE